MLTSVNKRQTSVFLAKGTKESEFRKRLEDKIKAEDKAAITKAQERYVFSQLSINEVTSHLSVLLGNLLPAVGVHRYITVLPGVDMDIQFGFHNSHNTMKFMMVPYGSCWGPWSEAKRWKFSKSERWRKHDEGSGDPIYQQMGMWNPTCGRSWRKELGNPLSRKCARQSATSTIINKKRLNELNGTHLGVLRADSQASFSEFCQVLGDIKNVLKKTEGLQIAVAHSSSFGTPSLSGIVAYVERFFSRYQVETVSVDHHFRLSKRHALSILQRRMSKNSRSHK